MYKMFHVKHCSTWNIAVSGEPVPEKTTRVL
jgi:hypothetical protein